ncbi:MAG: penicillin-binding protein 1C [Candidatus Peribacteraceae bacterium]|nr:penicillin-binding protein 1C [Candidatus Peribacteraceae bacterium]
MRLRRSFTVAAAVPVLLVLAAAFWPLPARVRAPTGQTSLRLLDREGRLLYTVRPPEGSGVHALPLRDIPRTLTDALIATEDRGFRDHRGVSIRGVVRAALQNLAAGRIVSGASTITQQLVRMRLPPGKRNVPRKLREMLYAWKLERVLSKEDILEAYLNEAYFGHRAYGVRNASLTFFGRNPQELSTGESAFLVGLLQAPGSYDPFRDPAPGTERRRRVLDAMLATGVITEEAHAQAAQEPLTLSRGRVSIEAPHFVFWLLEQREADLEGLTEVRTTIDLSLQREAERIVGRQLEALQDRNVTSAAVVVLDAHDGDVLAMVGSADYFDDAHDGAVNVAVAPRQPGSALKPFTYALALERGDTPATVVADVETQFLTEEGTPYVPRNYDYEYHGLVRYREALANSYNMAAVRVLERVGVSTLLSFLKDAGLSTLRRTPEHYGLALTLGDAETTLLELSRAYALFPRGGTTLPLRTLLDDPREQGRRLLSEQTAWLIGDILSDNDARLEEFGGDSPLAFRRPVAAKTGTTRNSRDNWTVGFTPDRIVGVWVGNADNAPMRGTSGVTGAGPIFHDVMEAAVRDLPPDGFPQPSGIVQAEICRLSGKLPTPACTARTVESFRAGTVPTEEDDIFTAVPVDARNGLLASDTCDPSHVQMRTFAVFPPDVRAWARETGWPEPPREPSPLCGTHAPTGDARLAIRSPLAGDTFEIDPLIPLASQKIPLRAEAGSAVRTVRWYVDGKHVGDGNAPDFAAGWTPSPGTWTVEAKAGEVSEHIVINVTKRLP